MLLLCVRRCLGGVVLSACLFILPVPEGDFTLLNHPLCAVLMVVLMLGIALLSPICANKANEYWTQWAETARFGNRLFNFYGFLAQDRKRAADMRIYNQEERVGRQYMQGIKVFSTDSVLAKMYRGPIGLWMRAFRSVAVIMTGVVYLFGCL